MPESIIENPHKDIVRQNRLLSLQTAERIVIGWLPLIPSKFVEASEIGTAIVGLATQFEDYILREKVEIPPKG